MDIYRRWVEKTHMKVQRLNAKPYSKKDNDKTSLVAGRGKTSLPHEVFPAQRRYDILINDKSIFYMYKKF